jgi:hypothetical protein
VAGAALAGAAVGAVVADELQLATMSIAAIVITTDRGNLRRPM